MRAHASWYLGHINPSQPYMVMLLYNILSGLAIDKSAWT